MNLFIYIKQQLTILDVVGAYASLKKAGLYWKGHCPFHHEKTASFTVSPHKEIFYCFGCHTGGDVITFIAQAERCTPIEAAQHLIERYQLQVPENLLREAGTTNSQEKQQHYNVCTLAADWFHEMLLKSPTALNYLHARGITHESVLYFGLGYVPGGLQTINRFMAHMQRHNILPDDLVQAHILSVGKTVFFSPFEERIIFPIKDHLGRTCGFGGRIFKEQDERAKYYNSREGTYFTKGSLLFGFDTAKNQIQKTETIMLVEGYLDCIAMVQHGFGNTVATLGTACTLEHLKIVSRYAQELVIVYDSDRAGHDAIIRLAQLCWQVDMELKVVKLPTGEDPASYLGKGQPLQPLIDQAQDIFLFFISSLGTAFATKNLTQKLQLTRKILETMQHIDDPLKKDFLLQKAAKTLDLSVAALKAELARMGTRPAPEKAPVAPAPQSDPEPGLKLEKKLFFAIMHNIHLLNGDNEEHVLAYLPDPYKGIVSKLRQAQAAHPTLTFSQFFDMLEHEQQQYVTKTLMEFQENPSPQEFNQLLLHLHKKQWQSAVRTMKMKLMRNEDTVADDTIEKTLQDFLELKKKLVHKTIK